MSRGRMRFEKRDRGDSQMPIYIEYSCLASKTWEPKEMICIPNNDSPSFPVFKVVFQVSVANRYIKESTIPQTARSPSFVGSKGLSVARTSGKRGYLDVNPRSSPSNARRSFPSKVFRYFAYREEYIADPREIVHV